MSIKLADRWIWDSWYVKDGDTYHAFYLCASRGLVDPVRRHRSPSVGHAISKDLVNWQTLPDALAPAESPAFDSWTTWTGSVIKDDDGLWWMFYTGSSRENEGLVQTIGAATSKDLINWQKLGTTPMVAADARWYEKLDLTAWGDEAWRDPWVFRFPGQITWHMLITARSKEGAPRSRGVVGHATSENLVDWQVQPPLSTPGQGFGQMEVFQFEIVDGVPVLIFCVGWAELDEAGLARYGERQTTYSLVVDEKLENLDFTKARPIPGPDIYAGRIIQGNDGKWNFMGFIDVVDGVFVGEICDPVPITADPEKGIVLR